VIIMIMQHLISGFLSKAFQFTIIIANYEIIKWIFLQILQLDQILQLKLRLTRHLGSREHWTSYHPFYSKGMKKYGNGIPCYEIESSYFNEAKNAF
jgi:hypothetical protein